MTDCRRSLCLLRRMFATVGLVLLVLTGIGVRRAVLNAQPRIGASLPFTLESALHYRRIRELFLGNGLPAVDMQIQVPGGIRTFETDTVGSEYIVAAIARRMHDEMTLPERVRWIHVVWFCLGIAALAIRIHARTGSWVGAGAGGLFYAVALSSVIRSTGQELSHENVALPLLLLHLALDALADRFRATGARTVARTGSAAALALALVTWDLIQFYIGLRALTTLVLLVRRPPNARGSEPPWRLEALFLVTAALVHPYLRAHRFLGSPVLGLYLAIAFVACVQRLPRLRRTVPPALAGGLGLGLSLLVAHLSGFADRYGHFGRLLAAKVRYLNIKPADPALLDFEQRIMWTPALHSASPFLVLQFFPALLLLTILGVALCYIRSIERFHQRAMDVEAHSFPVEFVWGLVSLLAFVLFVRFHVFAAVFCSAGLGIWIAQELRRPGFRRVAMATVCATGLFVEAAQTLARPARWGRRAPYNELNELAQWLRTHAPGETVLANFGVSSYVLTYAGTPIVLHPKFEHPEIRERVETYGTLLFKGNDNDFADWALRHGARIYIHALGEFSPWRPDYQMRYMVDALDPPLWAPARRLEWMPERLDRFELVWSNARYRVFRVLERNAVAAEPDPESAP